MSDPESSPCSACGIELKIAAAWNSAVRAENEMLEKYNEIAQTQIGLARLYLMRNEPARALRALDHYCAQTDKLEGERNA